MEAELSASLDKAKYVDAAGAGTSANLEAFSNQETPTDPDAPSSCVADPEGVPVSVCSLSDWEAVTTPDTTFFGVALVALAARDGVAVPGSRTRGHTHHQSL